MVADVQPFFDRARIFVAPTRFGAGIPLKVYQAAGFGLPVVCSSLVAEQLGWRDGVDLLVADTPDAFADRCRALYSDENLWMQLRQSALERVRAECSPQAFERTLADALEPPSEASLSLIASRGRPSRPSGAPG